MNAPLSVGSDRLGGDAYEALFFGVPVAEPLYLGVMAFRSMNPMADGVRRRPSLIEIGTRSEPRTSARVSSRPSHSNATPSR
jgi:hypothetical protein